MEARRQIEVDKQTREKLIKTYRTTNVSVWRALSYKDNSPKSQRIRIAAQEMGGIDIMLLPSLETFHDANGYMRQYLPKDVLIEVNRQDGHCDLLKKGEVVKSWDNITIPMLETIQKEAAVLCGVTVIM